LFKDPFSIPEKFRKVKTIALRRQTMQRRTLSAVKSVGRKGGETATRLGAEAETLGAVAKLWRG